VAQALQLSVMAGIRSDAIVAASGSARVVRAMPNTPALIGQGIAGLYARPEVEAPPRGTSRGAVRPTGQSLWVAREDDLDAVTALSGSGPAYVFYFLEAMVQAATEMGLTAEQGRTLAQATFAGAAALAHAKSPLQPAALREQVTSKGGTTHAAITSLEDSGVKAAFVQARCTRRAPRRRNWAAAEPGTASVHLDACRSPANATPGPAPRRQTPQSPASG
jgi:pyrroline-5-carboxylate reductase